MCKPSRTLYQKCPLNRYSFSNWLSGAFNSLVFASRTENTAGNPQYKCSLNEQP